MTPFQFEFTLSFALRTALDDAPVGADTIDVLIQGRADRYDYKIDEIWLDLGRQVPRQRGSWLLQTSLQHAIHSKVSELLNDAEHRYTLDRAADAA